VSVLIAAAPHRRARHHRVDARRRYGRCRAMRSGRYRAMNSGRCRAMHSGR